MGGGDGDTGDETAGVMAAATGFQEREEGVEVVELDGLSEAEEGTADQGGGVNGDERAQALALGIGELLRAGGWGRRHGHWAGGGWRGWLGRGEWGGDVVGRSGRAEGHAG